MISPFTSRATNIHKFYKNVPKWIASDDLYGSLNDFNRFGKNILLQIKRNPTICKTRF